MQYFRQCGAGVTGEMGNGFAALSGVQVMLLGVVWFGTLYLTGALFTTWLTRHLFPTLRIGRQLDPRALPAGQLRRELHWSAVSILIFGCGLVVPWGLLQLGWAEFAIAPSWWRILAEILLLFVWNELHFYTCHRLLHTLWLRRFHATHHRSHIATPFSTYAFHPVEALMLGSVPLLPMLAHDFSFIALASLPVMSLALNSLGHSNYEFSRVEAARGWLDASRRHHLHHACYHGNYGFLLSVFDRLLGTALPVDAADARIAARLRPGQSR